MIYTMIYLYILWDVCRPPITGLSTTDDLPKLLRRPQGLSRCYLLHMCITAYTKYFAFALAKMHCSSSILYAQFAQNMLSTKPALLHASSPPQLCAICAFGELTLPSVVLAK